MNATSEFRHDELVLGDVLRRRAAEFPQKTFLRFRDADVTFADFDELVDRTAHGLSLWGVARGSHVAVMLPNGLEFLQTVFVLARLGCPSVPINTAYKGDLLAHALHCSDSVAIVINEMWLPRIEAIRERVPQLRGLIVHCREGQPTLSQSLPMDVTDFRSLHERPAAANDADVHFGDLQSIIFTSGTTGPSKGVMVPHAHSLTCAADWIRHTRFQSDQRIYCPLPLFHGGALWDGVMSALLAAGEVCIVERFSASRYWDDIRHFRANVSLGVFSILPILLNQPPTPDDKNHSLRCFYFGQSALDEQFQQRFGARCVETYSSTEVGIATGSPYGQWRAGSCGRPNEPTYDVMIVDPWEREVPPGEPGEFVVRPRKPFAMATGYYGFWRETAEAFRNLWFHTGDRMYRDEDGFFYFVDRVSDTIRRRGENISSFEVERAVNSHPAVRESAAFGVPAEIGEDEVQVCVITEPGAALDEEDLIAHCEDRLPYFMVPRYLETVEDLPQSAIGKIQKHELRSRGESGVTPDTWDRVQAGYERKRE